MDIQTSLDPLSKQLMDPWLDVTLVSIFLRETNPEVLDQEILNRRTIVPAK